MFPVKDSAAGIALRKCAGPFNDGKKCSEATLKDFAVQSAGLCLPIDDHGNIQPNENGKCAKIEKELFSDRKQYSGRIV